MNLSFFRADASYCDFLRRKDPLVPYTRDEKRSRPFVGIVFEINGICYYAPLTSPKPKHLKMKNQLDFLKIKNGEWGAINFNNMIPIHMSSLSPVDMKITASDAKSDADYKNLLINQLSWCNANKNKIIRQAEKLYELVKNGTARAELLIRCCNFQEDEKQYKLYCETNGLN
jgi:protein AbiQ